MDEFVSKEAVLEILCKNCTENCTGGTPYRCHIPCVEWKLIQALTSADAMKLDRPKSHWGLRHYIDGNLDMTVCRNCNHEYSYDAETGEAAEDYYNFCPNCGAEMRPTEKSNESK